MSLVLKNDTKLSAFSKVDRQNIIFKEGRLVSWGTKHLIEVTFLEESYWDKGAKYVTWILNLIKVVYFESVFFKEGA